MGTYYAHWRAREASLLLVVVVFLVLFKKERRDQVFQALNDVPNHL
jgi:hypothetical protein